MWLFTKFGFYSVVKKKHYPEDKPFQVRARSRKDLENLVKKATLNSEIIETPKADYHYRITVDESELNHLFQLLQEELDYDNFKSMVSEQKGQKNKLGSYNEVWRTMYQFQVDEDKRIRKKEERENYSERVDKILGGMSNKRSLRCLFDPFASEWGDINMNKKLELLEKLLEVKPLSYWINAYSDFYTREANKPYVVKDIPQALVYLYKNADAELKNKIKPYLSDDPLLWMNE